MTLSELKKIVDDTIDPKYATSRDVGNIQVRIYDSGRSIGAFSSTGVKSASRGIDWDAGTFLIWPEKPLVKKPKNHEQKEKENAQILAQRYKLFCDRVVRELSSIHSNSYDLGKNIGDYIQKLKER